MHRVPKLRIHTAKRLAYVCLAGRQVYLGPAHSPEAHARYAALLADWRAGVPIEGAPPASAVNRLTMAEVAEAYLLHCVAKYGPRHQSTYESRYLAREVIAEHGAARVSDFGPRAFKAIRDRMRADGRSRQWVNRMMNAIRRCIRWAVSEEMAPADRLQALECVAGLRHGDAPEAPRAPPPIQPRWRLASGTSMRPGKPEPRRSSASCGRPGAALARLAPPGGRSSPSMPARPSALATTKPPASASSEWCP